jgi:hypothetical protein
MQVNFAYVSRWHLVWWLKNGGFLDVHLPLNIKLANVKHLVLAIARLHNFCIDKRLSQKAALGNQVVVFTPSNVAFDLHSANDERWGSIQRVPGNVQWIWGWEEPQ